MPSDEDKIVTIEIFASRGAAEIAVSKLEAHGIECWIKADDGGGVMPYLSAANGVRLQVLASDVEAVVDLLKTQPQMENSMSAGEEIMEPIRDRPKFIIVAGIWMIYGTGLIMNIFFLIIILSGAIGGGQRLIYSWISTGCCVFCIYMLYRSIRNYIIHKQREKEAGD